MNDEIETQEYRNRIADLKEGLPNVSGFSPQNLKYCTYFYRLYADSAVALSSPQVVDSNARPSPQLVDLQKEQGCEPKAANYEINRILPPVEKLQSALAELQTEEERK